MKNDCWVTILLISIFNINIDNSNDDKYSYSPHLGHIGSAVRLELGHEDPHDVQNEDQINLEIFLFLNKTGPERWWDSQRRPPAWAPRWDRKGGGTETSPSSRSPARRCPAGRSSPTRGPSGRTSQSPWWLPRYWRTPPASLKVVLFCQINSCKNWRKIEMWEMLKVSGGGKWLTGLTPAQQIEEEDWGLRVEYLNCDARVEVETFIEQPGRYQDIRFISISLDHVSAVLSGLLNIPVNISLLKTKALSVWHRTIRWGGWTALQYSHTS